MWLSFMSGLYYMNEDFILPDENDKAMPLNVSQSLRMPWNNKLKLHCWREWAVNDPLPLVHISALIEKGNFHWLKQGNGRQRTLKAKKLGSRT